MPWVYTLDPNIVEYLYEIDQTIKNRKYWTTYSYESTFALLDNAMNKIKASYRKITGCTLEDTSRRLFDNVETGGIETFINFYNGFLFVRKLEQKLRWHQQYGSFPR